MKKPFKSLFTIIIFSVSLQGFAQLDNTSGGNKSTGSSLGIISAPENNIEKPRSLEFNNNNGFKTAHTKQQKKQQKIAKEKELDTKGIFTPKMLTKQRYLKNMEKFRVEVPMIDKDMGSFYTKSKNIYINSFDFGELDGDVITIYKNGLAIISNYTLKKDLKTFSIPIDIGFNRIEILAVDEGRLRPNTGAFTIYDDFKEVISSDLWSLAKGAKVIALIVREEN